MNKYTILVILIVFAGTVLLTSPAQAGNYLKASNINNTVIIQTISIITSFISNVEPYTGPTLTGRLRFDRIRF